MSGYWSDFLTIAIAHFLAMAAPGPDFAIVLKQSLAGGRKTGVATAWGVGAAICLHVAYSLLGLGFILRSSPAVFTAVKLAGAGYLAWIGYQALKAKPVVERDLRARWVEPRSGPELELCPARPEVALHHGTAWRIGFLTNALNPKVTLFFLAIFTTLVRPGTPLAIRLVYGAWIALSTGLWFTLVAFLFTHPTVRRGFLRYGCWIDRTLGVVFIAFALVLAGSTIA